MGGNRYSPLIVLREIVRESFLTAEPTRIPYHPEKQLYFEILNRAIRDLSLIDHPKSEFRRGADDARRFFLCEPEEFGSIFLEICEILDLDSERFLTSLRNRGLLID